MEESKPSSGFEIPWRLVIVLAGMALGYVAITPPLRIQARLWQDPIQVIEAELAASRTNGGVKSKTTEDMGSQLAESRCSSSCRSGKVRVMMVIVSGGYYAIDVETRLRSRYAILSGLGAAGYSPKDADHLDYFRMKSDTGKDLLEEDSVSRTNQNVAPPRKRYMHVAFEWFKPCPTVRSAEFCRANSEVVVWWVRTEDLGNQPLDVLSQLEEETRDRFLHTPPGTNTPAIRSDLEFLVIGPRTSTGLRDMLDEAASQSVSGNTNGPSGLKARLQGTQMYSPWATAADAFLTGQTKGLPREKATEILSGGAGVTFHNCTATDEQLADALVRELSLRGVNLGNTNREIVLLAEWDTFYGRALPMTFMSQAWSRITRTNEFIDSLRLLQQGNVRTKWFRRYSYLRGVDGEVGRMGTGGATEGDANAAKKPSSDKQNERPEGQGQWDYVRRIASNVDEEVSRGEGWAKVCAVGVLGGDVYDKLLLLQALRDRVKGVLFFTTDLEALYLDQSQHNWTRNLLVASSFGLQLPGQQADIPPFRDTYQTAQFLACREALGEHPRSKISEFTGLVEPWMFEIGRTEAVPLDTEDRLGKLPKVLSMPESENTNTGSREGDGSTYLNNRQWSRKWLLANLALPFLFLLALSPCIPALRRFLFKLPERGNRDLKPGKITEAIKEVRKRRGKFQFRFFKYLLWTIAGVEVLLVLISFSKSEEPLRWFQGVSIWPTEFVRLAALFLCWWFILKIRFDSEEGRLELSRDYFLPDKPPPEDKVIDCPKLQRGSLPGYLGYVHEWVNLRRKVGLAFEEHASTEQEQKPTETFLGVSERTQIRAMDLFMEYCLRAPWRHRIVRTVPVVAVQVLLTLALMWVVGFPFRPYRGPISGTVDIIVFSACFGSAILLMALVLDAAQLCKEFVERLGDGRTLWPSEVLWRNSSELGMEEEDLDGWLDVRFVAEYTARVGQTVYYPFLVVLLLVAAQSHFVDNWTCSLPLVVVIGIIVLYSIYSALLLRKSAEKVRKDAIETLGKRISLCSGQTFKWEAMIRKSPKDYERTPRDGNYAKKLTGLHKEIMEEKRGAFAPFLMDPAIGAVIFSAVGTGLTLLIQYYQGGH
jgi:hypothetical protein